MTKLLAGASLAEAREARASRLQQAEDREIEALLDQIGITEQKCLELEIDPVERKQLKGIIARLRKVAHPFTTCMRDLRKHKPEWTEDRRKRTCQSLKIAAGRKEGGKKLSEFSEAPCVLLTDGMVRLLESADQDKLKALAQPQKEKKAS